MTNSLSKIIQVTLAIFYYIYILYLKKDLLKNCNTCLQNHNKCITISLYINVNAILHYIHC